MALNSPLHLQAVAYAVSGRPIFPCRVGAKEPATAAGFKDATTDLDQINRWWGEADYNIGFEPESEGLCVLDLDGQIGIDNWKDSRPTYAVRTPRGGKHLYYKGSLPPSAGKLAQGVDTRGRGSYVLLAPSVVNGKRYEVINGADPVPVLPWVAEALASRQEAAKDVAPEHVDPVLAEKRAREYLRTLAAAGPVLEGTRDNTAFKVACTLRDLGIVGDAALDLMLELFDPLCVPPLGSEILGAKIESARDYAKNGEAAWANAPAAETFATAIGITGIASQPARALPEPIRLGDISGDEHPVETIVEGWVQKHKLNLLRGRGGSNKSRLALQWAMLIDAGQDKAGFRVQKATCLFLGYEDDTEEMKRRRNAIKRKLDLPPSGVLYFDMVDTENSPLIVVTDLDGVAKSARWDDLEKRLLAIEGHKFVVLDSTYDVIDFIGATKNSDNHVRTVIRMFDRLARATDSTFLCLWHPSRAGMSRGDEGGFATSWDNTPRNAVSIKPVQDEDNTFELVAEKRNNMAKGEPMILRWVEGALIPVSKDDATAAMEHEEVIALAIKAAETSQPVTKRGHPETWFFDELVKRIGRRMNMKEVRGHLMQETLKEDGRLYYHNYDATQRGLPAGWHERKPKNSTG